MAHVPGAQSLNTSRDQALHALLGSLAQADQNASHNDSQLSAEQVRKLADKLEELVGDVGSTDLSQQQNESGELVNEEGLPIIEVTEPLPDVEPATASEPMIIHDDLIPLSSLPMSERERQRAERDRILNLLEQEESVQQMKNDELIQEQRRELSQKRKENAQREMERLKAAREMQKKMGRALLRNMADAREEQEKTQKEISCQDQTVEQQKKTIHTKKSVSFAELPAGGSEPKDRSSMHEKEVQLDWGDVAPGRLRSANRARLTTKAQMDKHPMKMDVVERLPVSQLRAEELTADTEDSDDESVPSSPVSVDSDEGVSFLPDRGDEELDEDFPHSGSDGDGLEDDLGLEDEEFDLDAAHHQREIALAYYEKRGLIGEDAARAMTSHTHDEGETEWNQPEVPLDATLSHPQPKSTMSRFKADRITLSHSTSTPTSSTSLGPSVLPASGYQSLQRAIRTGRLENDTLVGGEAGDSASEPEDESAQAVLELLKKGEVYNAGPTLNSVTPSPASTQALPPHLLPPQAIGNTATPTSLGVRAPVGALASASKSKVSKFKLNRTQGPRGQSLLAPGPNIANAGSPSLPRPSTSIDGPDHGESTFTSSSVSTPQTSRSPPVLANPTQFPTVIESPSFPPTHQIPSSNLESKPSIPTASGRRPDRPPTVMSAAVLESTGGVNSSRNRPIEQRQGKKVSRFLAERM